MFRFCTLVLCLATGACASSGAVPQPFPMPDPPPSPARAPAPVGTSGTAGDAIAGTALGLRGIPYRNGGSDPSGFDCSGFIRYVFAEHGVAVPRTVTELFRMGSNVSANRLAPGDLVFFRIGGRAVSHVGMSLGGDEFVHAPSSQGEVRVERLASSYWARRFAGARRISY